MNEITKLELFAAYLPYEVRCSDGGCDYQLDCVFAPNSSKVKLLNNLVLYLRPLTALQTPMLHPVTGERIESPAEWIAGKSGACDSDVITQLKFNLVINDQTDIIRAIDRLALSLHFDIYGAIEKGWAVQI
jgi:hypothetical protein